jgi:hypothetical protein
MFDAPDAEAALGRSAVTAAMADPLTVTVKKSLLVFISIGIPLYRFGVSWRSNR